MVLLNYKKIAELPLTNDVVSPLYHVAKNGFPDILKLFLDYGADINVEDEFEETPLDIAKSEK